MVPARILRAEADDMLQQRRLLSPRDLAREDEIIRAATRFFADHGRCEITFRNLATALRIGTPALRRYFTDLDALLHEILSRHLQAIIKAFGSLKPEQSASLAARRDAYRRATRGPVGTPSPVHLLLIQQRFTLPPDLLQPIDAAMEHIAGLLAPTPADLTFAILDNPLVSPEHAAAMLDTPPPAPPEAKPEPDPPTEAPPKPPRKPPEPGKPRFRFRGTLPTARKPFAARAGP